MLADNKRLAKLGDKVITRISARRLSVSDKPNCVQLLPNFAMRGGMLYTSGEDVVPLYPQLRQAWWTKTENDIVKVK